MIKTPNLKRDFINIENTKPPYICVQPSPSDIEGFAVHDFDEFFIAKFIIFSKIFGLTAVLDFEHPCPHAKLFVNIQSLALTVEFPH